MVDAASDSLDTAPKTGSRVEDVTPTILETTSHSPPLPEAAPQVMIWTDTPRKLQSRTQNPRSTKIEWQYSIWMTFGASLFMFDTWPECFTAEDVRYCNNYYRTMPERHDKQTRLPVITLHNCVAFVARLNAAEMPADFLKIFSVASNATLSVSRSLQVSFPVDFCYGWELRVKEHSNLLHWCRTTLRVLVNLYSPKCTSWSRSSVRGNHEDIQRLQLNETGTLQWIAADCENLDTTRRLWIVENPRTNSIWKKSPLANLGWTTLMPLQTRYDATGGGYVLGNLMDQCTKGVCIEKGEQFQKCTLFKARSRLQRTGTKCKCPPNKPHAVLQGSHDGINRIARAAVFPGRLGDDLLHKAQCFTEL